MPSGTRAKPPGLHANAIRPPAVSRSRHVARHVADVRGGGGRPAAKAAPRRAASRREDADAACRSRLAGAAVSDLQCRAGASPCFTPRGRPAARPHTGVVFISRAGSWASGMRDGRWSGSAQAARWCASAVAGGRQGCGCSRASASRPVSASLSAGRARARASSLARSRARCGAATAASEASRGSPRRSRGALLTGGSLLAGTRATERFEQTLHRRTAQTVRDTSRDTSPGAAGDRQRLPETGGGPHSA